MFELKLCFSLDMRFVFGLAVVATAYPAGPVKVPPIRLRRVRGNLLSPDFVFAGVVGQTPLNLLLDSGAHYSWLYATRLGGDPILNDRAVTHTVREQAHGGTGHAFNQYLDGGNDRVWLGRLYLDWAPPVWGEGDWSGVIAAGPRSDLLRSGTTVALIPSGEELYMVYNAAKSSLASTACKSRKFDFTAQVSENHWDVAGTANLFGLDKPRREVWRLSTGARTIQLSGTAWAAFSKQITREGRKVGGWLPSGEALITGCANRRALPIVDVTVGTLTVSIDPSDYLVDLHDGTCHLLVTSRGGDAKFSVLGAPFMRNVVSHFANGKKEGPTLDLCLPVS